VKCATGNEEQVTHLSSNGVPMGKGWKLMEKGGFSDGRDWSAAGNQQVAGIVHFESRE
jgi:hypothetical protein